MVKSIIIIDSDTSTGELKLKDGQTLDAHSLDLIEWSIEDAKVFSFRIEKKPKSPNIFWSSSPQLTHANTGSGLILPASGKKDYHYSIFWKKDKDSKELQHDPIISVKPSGMLFFFSFLISLFTFSSFVYWLKLKKNRK